jgi:hypothetical protein
VPTLLFQARNPNKTLRLVGLLRSAHPAFSRFPGVQLHIRGSRFDPGSIWLRKLMLETGRGLDRPKRRAD